MTTVRNIYKDYLMAEGCDGVKCTHLSYFFQEHLCNMNYILNSCCLSLKLYKSNSANLVQ